VLVRKNLLLRTQVPPSVLSFARWAQQNLAGKLAKDSGQCGEFRSRTSPSHSPPVMLSHAPGRTKRVANAHAKSLQIECHLDERGIATLSRRACQTLA
jgi:hypothetical protein